MEISGKHHVPSALTPGNIPRIHWIGRWGYPRAGLVVLDKRKSVVLAWIRTPDHPALSSVDIPAMFSRPTINQIESVEYCELWGSHSGKCEDPDNSLMSMQYVKHSLSASVHCTDLHMLQYVREGICGTINLKSPLVVLEIEPQPHESVNSD